MLKRREFLRTTPPITNSLIFTQPEEPSCSKFTKKINPNSQDEIYRLSIQQSSTLTQKNHKNNKSAAHEKSLYQGIDYFTKLQLDDGCWAGDYGGPLFLLPSLIITAHVTETEFPSKYKTLMVLYLRNHQNSDGGWGGHIEASSTMFGTVLHYVALRLLETPPNTPELIKARAWIHSNGSPLAIPTWGKVFLSILSLYEWKGCHSINPEIWLLPKALPFHPSRFWCHSRLVYLPMSYCFGHRVKTEVTPLTESIRKELYTTDYQDIKWEHSRSFVAETDQYVPPNKLRSTFLNSLNSYEKIANEALRKKALEFVLEYIQAEDTQTNYINLGPINQVLNSICLWHAFGKDSPQFKAHVKRWEDYLWIAEDGLKMCGYNGSQLWDTALFVRSILESNPGKNYKQTINNAFCYIRDSQIVTPLKNAEQFFRHQPFGGFPFSTREQGWPTADCTAEGLSSLIKIWHSKTLSPQNAKTFSHSNLRMAVDSILSLQNDDGGWATYEKSRAPEWLEHFNASEIFGQIMIEHSWVECTSSCMQALCDFLKIDLTYRKSEIKASIMKGLSFILQEQRADGSWIGSWGICFTYGTWFAVEALQAVVSEEILINSSRINLSIKRAHDFLLSKQNPDGGWGESYLSCQKEEYIETETSQTINTSWALLTLMSNGSISKDTQKGIQLLIERQELNGDWKQERISGIFNKTCAITYSSYRNIFPIWALSRYYKLNTQNTKQCKN